MTRLTPSRPYHWPTAIVGPLLALIVLLLATPQSSSAADVTRSGESLSSRPPALQLDRPTSFLVAGADGTPLTRGDGTVVRVVVGGFVPPPPVLVNEGPISSEETRAEAATVGGSSLHEFQVIEVETDAEKIQRLDAAKRGNPAYLLPLE